jgi:hypothetical protein
MSFAPMLAGALEHQMFEQVRPAGLVFGAFPPRAAADRDASGREVSRPGIGSQTTRTPLASTCTGGGQAEDLPYGARDIWRRTIAT